MTTTLQVGGMTCQHCVHAVTKALQGVAGVERVSVSLERGRALVDGVADARLLVQALVDEGYEAKLAGAG
jgi:copper chaperone